MKGTSAYQPPPHLVQLEANRRAMQAEDRKAARQAAAWLLIGLALLAGALAILATAA